MSIIQHVKYVTGRVVRGLVYGGLADKHIGDHVLAPQLFAKSLHCYLLLYISGNMKFLSLFGIKSYKLFCSFNNYILVIYVILLSKILKSRHM